MLPPRSCRPVPPCPAPNITSHENHVPGLDSPYLACLPNVRTPLPHKPTGYITTCINKFVDPFPTGGSFRVLCASRCHVCMVLFVRCDVRTVCYAMCRVWCDDCCRVHPVCCALSGGCCVLYDVVCNVPCAMCAVVVRCMLCIVGCPDYRAGVLCHLLCVCCVQCEPSRDARILGQAKFQHNSSSAGGTMDRLPGTVSKGASALGIGRQFPPRPENATNNAMKPPPPRLSASSHPDSEAQVPYKECRLTTVPFKKPCPPLANARLMNKLAGEKQQAVKFKPKPTNWPVLTSPTRSHVQSPTSSLAPGETTSEAPSSRPKPSAAPQRIKPTNAELPDKQQPPKRERPSALHGVPMAAPPNPTAPKSTKAELPNTQQPTKCERPSALHSVLMVAPPDPTAPKPTKAELQQPPKCQRPSALRGVPMAAPPDPTAPWRTTCQKRVRFNIDD